MVAGASSGPSLAVSTTSEESIGKTIQGGSWGVGAQGASLASTVTPSGRGRSGMQMEKLSPLYGRIIEERPQRKTRSLSNPKSPKTKDGMPRLLKHDLEIDKPEPETPQKRQATGASPSGSTEGSSWNKLGSSGGQSGGAQGASAAVTISRHPSPRPPSPGMPEMNDDERW